MNGWLIVLIALAVCYIVSVIAESIKEWRISKAQLMVAVELAKEGCRVDEQTGKVEYIPVYAKYGKDSGQDEGVEENEN